MFECSKDCEKCLCCEDWKGLKDMSNLCSTCVYNEKEYECVPCPNAYGYCLNYKEEEKVSE